MIWKLYTCFECYVTIYKKIYDQYDKKYAYSDANMVIYVCI